MVYGVGSLLLQAASIVLLPLYTRYLNPADFGILEILSRTGQVISTLLMANGIATATFTFYCQAKTPRMRRRTAATVTLFLGIVLLVAAVLIVVFARPLGLLIGVDSPTLAAVGILAALADCTTVIPLCLAQARVESVYYVSVSLAMFVCRVTIITLAVAVLGWGIWGVLWASIATAVLFGVILNAREFWNVAFRPELSQFGEIFRFVFPFVPGGLCFFVLNSGDRFFLVKTAGAEELGLYALGSKLAMAVSLFSFLPLFKVWSARMFDAFALPEAAVVVGRTCTRILGAYVFVGLGLCIFIDEVIAVFASAQYARSAAIVAPLTLAFLFSNAANLADGVFYAHRRTGLKPWIMFVSMIVICGLYACLIPPFGAMGAAVAAAAGFLFHATATWWVSQRVFRVRYEYGRLAGILTAAVVLVLLASRLPLGLLTIPAKLALWTFWPVFLWMTGLISREEKTLAVDYVRQALRVGKKMISRQSVLTVPYFLRRNRNRPLEGVEASTPTSHETR